VSLVFPIRPEPQVGLSRAAFFFSPPEGMLGSPALRRELESLARESDPRLYSEGLFGVALRQEQENHLESALQIYQALESAPLHEVSQRARARREAITGRGSFGARAEFLLRRVADEAADPSTLFAMGAAGAIFRMTRLATLSRLAGIAQPGFLTRLLGASRMASLVGFAVEAPAFTLLSRGSREILGRSQDWSLPGLGRDLASSYLLLGGLRLTGALGQTIGAWSGASPLRQALFQQGSTLTGILLGHRLEAALGLRPQVEGATVLADSLAMLLQFHVAGRLTGAVFEGSAASESALESLAARPATRGPSERRPWFLEALPALVTGNSPSFPEAERPPSAPTILAMAAHNPAAGNGSSAGTRSIGQRVEEHLRRLSREPAPQPSPKSTAPAIEFRFEGISLPADSGARQAFFRDTLQLLLDQQDSGYAFSLCGELSQALRSNGSLRGSLPGLKATPEHRWIADIRADGHELKRLAFFEEVGGQWRPRRVLIGTLISRYDESQDPAVYDLDFSAAETGKISGNIYRPTLDGRWEADRYLSQSFVGESGTALGRTRWLLYPKTSYALTVDSLPQAQPLLRIQDLTGYPLFSLGTDPALEPAESRRGS